MRARKKALNAKIEELESLHGVLSASFEHADSIEEKACELLDLSMQRALEQQRALPRERAALARRAEGLVY